MNKVFITLSFLMGAVVLISNYLVQFPINYFNLDKILILATIPFKDVLGGVIILTKTPSILILTFTVSLPGSI